MANISRRFVLNVDPHCTHVAECSCSHCALCSSQSPKLVATFWQAPHRHVFIMANRNACASLPTAVVMRKRYSLVLALVGHEQIVPQHPLGAHLSVSGVLDAVLIRRNGRTHPGGRRRQARTSSHARWHAAEHAEDGRAVARLVAAAVVEAVGAHRAAAADAQCDAVLDAALVGVPPARRLTGARGERQPARRGRPCPIWDSGEPISRFCSCAHGTTSSTARAAMLLIFVPFWRARVNVDGATCARRAISVSVSPAACSRSMCCTTLDTGTRNAG